MEDLLRRLGEVFETEHPVLSIYLDMRPQAAGEKPGQRESETMLRDRLRDIEKTITGRGDYYTSFQADVERINNYIANEFSTDAQGLAIFACNAANLFETVESATPFNTQVSIGQQPELFQLAKMLDDSETALAVLLDTNTARIFVTRYGKLEEIELLDDPNTKNYHKSQVGGWSQARYQRNVDENRAAFARDLSTEIDHLIEAEKPDHLFLIGNDTAIPIILNELSFKAKEILVEEKLHLDIRAGEAEVKSEVEPILQHLNAQASMETADKLIAEVQSGRLGVTGLEQTRKALEYGQVDTLLLDEAAELAEDTRSELISMATTTSATVEVVKDHPIFHEMGGVGAILRYKV